VGAAAAFRVLLHRARELFHAARRLLQRGGLLLGALREVRVAVGDLARGLDDHVAARVHLLDDPRQVLAHAPDAVPEAFGVAALDVARGRAHREVAEGDALHHAADAPHAEL